MRIEPLPKANSHGQVTACGLTTALPDHFCPLWDPASKYLNNFVRFRDPAVFKNFTKSVRNGSSLTPSFWRFLSVCGNVLLVSFRGSWWFTVAQLGANLTTNFGPNLLQVVREVGQLEKILELGWFTVELANLRPNFEIPDGRSP